MLFAERHNKLGRDSARAHDRAEDLLTSTAFQLLRYVPLETGLFAVLSRVRRVRWVDGDVRVEPEQPSWLEYAGATRFDSAFWPWWPGAGEPDVVVTLLRDSIETARFVFEVKLHAPKSPRGGAATDDTEDEEERRKPDQLWDYFKHLSKHRSRVPCGLVYLTSHSIPPLDELRQSLECCSAARGSDWLGWLSWRDVWAAMRQAGARELPAQDLAGILAAKGLKAFDGYHALPIEVPPPPWHFYHQWFSSNACWTPAGGEQRFWESRRKQR